MPSPESPGAGAEAGPRCTRCGIGVGGTVHTRTTYTVGYYRLHGGRTVEGTIRRGEDEAPLVYRRLMEAVEVVSCPACLATAEMRALWDRFGEPERVDA
jgi:hypothetical protein